VTLRDQTYPNVSSQLHRKQALLLYPLLFSLQLVDPFQNSIHQHIGVVLTELPMVNRWVLHWMLVEVGTDMVKGIAANTDKERPQELTVGQIRKMLVAEDMIDLVEFG
jgi:hypothetical protein